MSITFTKKELTSGEFKLGQKVIIEGSIDQIIETKSGVIYSINIDNDLFYANFCKVTRKNIKGAI